MKTLGANFAKFPIFESPCVYWEVCGGGYGIHWPEIDEDLSTEGLLRGSPAPNAKKQSPKINKNLRSRSSKYQTKK